MLGSITRRSLPLRESLKSNTLIVHARGGRWSRKRPVKRHIPKRVSSYIIHFNSLHILYWSGITYNISLIMYIIRLLVAILNYFII